MFVIYIVILNLIAIFNPYNMLREIENSNYSNARSVFQHELTVNVYSHATQVSSLNNLRHCTVVMIVHSQITVYYKRKDNIPWHAVNLCDPDC